MTRDDAYKLLTEMMSNKNLIKHGLAVEVIMRALCNYLRGREFGMPSLVSGNENPHPTSPSRGGGESVVIPLREKGDSVVGSSPLERGRSTRPAELQQSGKVGDEEFDEEEWAIVGLLHDADYELVEKDPARHTLVTEEKLRPMGVSDRVINGIKAHHDGIKEGRDNFLEKAVYASDDISGLITACALVKDKKLSNVTVETVMKNFNKKSFAAGAKREQILACERELDIPLEEFVAIALKAMQGISSELGL